MKYVLFFCGTLEQYEDFQKLSPDQLTQQYARVGAWFQEHGAKMRGGEQLQPPSSATTVHHQSDGSAPPVVTDGPFIEGKEAIGGFAIVEVEDLDEALRMARSWPGRGSVEIRPVMAR